MRSAAPTASARSRMIRRPSCSGPTAAGSNPRPSSPTTSSTAASEPRQPRPASWPASGAPRCSWPPGRCGTERSSTSPGSGGACGDRELDGGVRPRLRSACDDVLQQVAERRLRQGSRTHLHEQRAHLGEGAAREALHVEQAVARPRATGVSASRYSASAVRLAAKSDCVTESWSSRARRERSAAVALRSTCSRRRAFSTASAAWSPNDEARPRSSSLNDLGCGVEKGEHAERVAAHDQRHDQAGPARVCGPRGRAALRGLRAARVRRPACGSEIGTIDGAGRKQRQLVAPVQGAGERRGRSRRAERRQQAQRAVAVVEPKEPAAVA